MTRPLPELTVQNEFFWTAGGDGVLRIQQCQDCAALIHPPQPVCRYCRSHKMGVRDVSGNATLSAFTVNHRFGFPDLPPPYVVAQVAIVEDPRVRLTTNIVDCDPDDLEMGQTVVVQPNVVTMDRKAGVQTGELLLVGEHGAERLHAYQRGLLRAPATPARA